MKIPMQFWKLLTQPDQAFFNSAPPDAAVMNYGCGNRKQPGHIGVDIAGGADADHIITPGDRLPFPDDSFDMVISRFVLEHVDNIDQLLGEICRVLRPGGVFRFCVPHAFSMDMYDDPTHRKFYTLRTMNYFTGASNVHYAKSSFEEAGVFLRLTLGWPRWRIVRYPINVVLGLLGMAAPTFGEQLVKLPFITGTIFFELKKHG